MNIKGLVLLAFFGSISILFLMLSCALPQYGVYWPLFNLMFYFLSPIPLMISNRSNDGSSSSGACKELALFFTTVVVISAFALPVTLANSKVIQWGACAFSMAGTFVAFFTILGFFTFFNDDSEYSRW